MNTQSNPRDKAEPEAGPQAPRQPAPSEHSGQSQFRWVKFLSWTSLLLILGTNLFLSGFIARSARETLLEKQQEFALLMAENLNHQIFQRFTLPTLLRFGRIELQREEQYGQLDLVVQSTVHGLHVSDLSVFDYDKVISYSMDKKRVGRDDLAGESVVKALDDGRQSFQIISSISPVKAMFSLDREPGSVVLKTTYPLRAERSLYPGAPSGQIMGILEFSQDITDDYGAVIHFQWLIIISSVLSSLFLFLILVLFIRRAGQINALRQERTRALQKELDQSEKLASMGRVVAGIAHEIRNPLGIIRSSAELLYKKMSARPGGETAAEVRIFGAMLDEVKRLSQTVNDFLDYARPRNPRRDAVDLAEIMDQAMVFLDHEFKNRNIEAVRGYDRGLVIRGDKDLLYRAFYNILGNAMQALDKGGTITISGKAEKAIVNLVFEDTGPGFDSESVDKAADPFYTTKDHGTGLGLAIVSNILAGHGATLTLENAEEKGARVTVTFPAP